MIVSASQVKAIALVTLQGASAVIKMFVRMRGLAWRAVYIAPRRRLILTPAGIPGLFRFQPLSFNLQLAVAGTSQTFDTSYNLEMLTQWSGALEVLCRCRYWL